MYIRAFGYLLLILALPLALAGLIVAPNEYQAMGMAGVADCEGPSNVFLFGWPALAIYATGAILNGIDFRRAHSVVIALLCLGVCIGLSVNLVRAWNAGEANAAERSCA